MSWDAFWSIKILQILKNKTSLVYHKFTIQIILSIHPSVQYQSLNIKYWERRSSVQCVETHIIQRTNLFLLAWFFSSPDIFSRCGWRLSLFIAEDPRVGGVWPMWEPAWQWGLHLARVAATAQPPELTWCTTCEGAHHTLRWEPNLTLQ